MTRSVSWWEMSAVRGLQPAWWRPALRSSLRPHLDHITGSADLGRVIGRVNVDLVRDTRPHQFATMFFGIFESAEQQLTYVSAGHEPAILVRGGRCILLEVGGWLWGLTRQKSTPR